MNRFENRIELEKLQAALTIVIDNDIIENSMNDKETVVKLGETIGKKY